MAYETETEKIVKQIWNAAKYYDKQALRDSISIYNDSWVDIIDFQLRLQFSDPDSLKNLRPLISTEMNLCKKVVDETAMVYEDKAIRTATKDGAEDSDKRYEEIVAESHIDSVMKTVNRYTQLLNHVLVRPVVRRLKLEYDIILPDNFEIYTSCEDWRDIVAIKYYIGERPQFKRDFYAAGLSSGDVVMKPGSLTDEREGYLWVRVPIEYDRITFEPGVYKFDPKKNTMDWKASWRENEYKDAEGNAVLPFMLTYKEWPVDSLLNFSKDSSVSETAVDFAIYWTMLNEQMKFQSFKQMVITAGLDLTLPGELKTGPAKVFVLKSENNNAGIEVLDMQSDIKTFEENIQHRAAMFLAQYGISASQFTLSGTPQSGYSMKIDREPLMEIRNNQIEFYRMFEKDLFELTRIVNNTDLPNRSISVDAEFHIDFSEVDFDPTPDEDARYWTFKFTNNLATPIDYLMEKNKDLDEDGARILFEKWRVRLFYNSF